MYYIYRLQEEHGAYVTGENPDYPMPAKSEYLLLSVRERIAANLVQEALSGKRRDGKRMPDIQKATTRHEFQQQELTQFVSEHPPTPKTELQVLRILDQYLPPLIDK